MLSKPVLIAAAVGAVIAVAIAVPWVLLASRPATVAVATTRSAKPARSATPGPARSQRPGHRRRHHHHASPAATPAGDVVMLNCQASLVVTPPHMIWHAPMAVSRSRASHGHRGALLPHTGPVSCRSTAAPRTALTEPSSRTRRLHW
jgi:hypothetical protein